MTESLLIERDDVPIREQNDTLDLEAFYRRSCREGLFFESDFADRILAAARIVEKIPFCSLDVFDLERYAHDSEIQAEIQKKLKARGATFEQFVFTEVSLFCAWLAQMITNQWGGRLGPLVMTEIHPHGSGVPWIPRGNNFYVTGIGGEVFCVNVGWVIGAQAWNIGAQKLDSCGWGEGRRIFGYSPNMTSFREDMAPLFEKTLRA